MKDGDILVDSVDVLWGENKETAVGGQSARKGEKAGNSLRAILTT